MGWACLRQAGKLVGWPCRNWEKYPCTLHCPSPPTQSGAEDPPPQPRTSKNGAFPTALPRQGGIQGPLAYLPGLGLEFGADDGAFCTLAGVKVLTPALPFPSV